MLAIDRHLLHDLEGGASLRRIADRGLKVHNPELTFSVPDHAVATHPTRRANSTPNSSRLLREMKEGSEASGITYFDLGSEGQGIVHVIGPELGLSQPGMTIVCGDSHTCTHGGLGALSFGIGATEIMHVLATQTLRQTKPKTMRVRLDGKLAPGVAAKDVILATIGQVGTGAGRGHAVEFAGSTIRAMSVEQRLTVCNLSIELGAKIGMIAPDDTAFEYLAGRTLCARRRDVRPRLRPLAHVADRRRRPFRRRACDRRREDRAADHLGHEPAGCDRGRSAHSGSRARNRSAAPAGDGGGAGLHGPQTG